MEQQVNYSTPATMARLLRYSKAYYLYYVGLLFIVACASFVNLGYLEAVRQIVSGATSKTLQPVYYGAVLAGLTTGLQLALSLLQEKIMVKLKNQSITSMQSHVLNELYGKKQEELDSFHSSDLVGRLLNSVTAAQTGISEKALTLFSNVMQVVMAMAYFTWLNLPLTLGLMGFALSYPLLAYPISRYLRVLHDRHGDDIAHRDIVLQEAVQGSQDVRVYRLQGYLAGLLGKRLDRAFARALKISLFERGSEGLNRLAMFGGMIFTLGFGGYQTLKGDLAVATLATFVVTSGQLTNPLLSVARLWTEMIGSIAQAKRVFSLFDLPDEEAKEANEAQEANKAQKADKRTEAAAVATPETFDPMDSSQAVIALKKVSFQYRDGAEALKDISFQVQKGQLAAIVGASGSGKSTIMKLLLRLYRPDRGELLYRNAAIQNMELDQWRAEIGYVSQDTVLFTGTVRDNICFGLTSAPQSEVETAARLAHLHDKIASFPQGYDTIVGERGVQLSGGEKQRLALARAYMRRPNLLLLDEPTSALDIENEEKFRASLLELMKGRTTIMIAHQLDTVISADLIIVLKDGRIEETGKHEELMRRQGHYYALVQSQLA
jgi:ABC-type multidrug transport system fused ATPase/permease subunit